MIRRLTLAATLIAAITLVGCTTEVVVSSVDGPTTINTNEAATYTVTVNEDASDPVAYNWDMGDGGSADAAIATHSFTGDGTYTVTVTATNGKGKYTSSGSIEVRVIAPPEVVTVVPSQTMAEPGEAIRFTANVSGTAPITYAWDFGDGTTSSEANPNHSYSRDGTFTVSMRASNEGGEIEAQTFTITVETPPQPPTSLASTNFDFDKALLDDAAQAALMANIDALAEFPGTNIQVDGFTDHVGSDQYNLRLSQKRAGAVEAFYIENGFSASRLTKRGLGKAPVPCASQDNDGRGCRENRRAESLPMSSEG